MDERKYDEFGSLIDGSEEYSSSDEDDEEEEEEEEEGEDDGDGEIGDGEDGEESVLKRMELALRGTDAPSEIVQYDEKQYYKTTGEIFGPEVETMVEMEDMNPIEQATISAKKTKQWEQIEVDIPETKYDTKYLSHFMSNPNRIRNVALIGNLHSGKTSLIDTFVSFTHLGFKNKTNMKYTDHTFLERKREISIKAAPMTFLLPNSSGKSFACNILDTPGHINFLDEVSASLRLCDGAVLVVDSLEGLTLSAQKQIDLCMLESIPIVLFLNKIDRLVMELRLPPIDSYAKLRHLLGEINQYVMNHPLRNRNTKPFSPKHSNVLFGCSEMHFIFTLETFARRIYSEKFKKNRICPKKMARKLWGEWYFDHESSKFIPKKTEKYKKHSFVEFVLEPLYKIFSHTVGSEPKDLVKVLRKMKVHLSKKEMMRNIKPLFITIFKKLFPSPCGFVDSLVQYIPPSDTGNNRKISHHYTGDLTALPKPATSSQSPLFVLITKSFHRPGNPSKSDVFGRVIGGTIKPGDVVRVLGEHFQEDDPEDMTEQKVEAVYMYNSRYKIGLSHAGPGNLVLISGVSESITKTATITSPQSLSSTFRPLFHPCQSVIKVSVEPLKPSELPKLTDGLRSVEKSYPSLVSKAEESGERVLIGSGELYMDCVLHDLRRIFSGIEVKVSDPVVTFRETVSESSSIRCSATTPNGKNQFSLIAQPMEKGLGLAIEQKGGLSLESSLPYERENFLSQFGWDKLSVKGLWAFGPTPHGPNCFLNETFPNEVSPDSLKTVKDFLVQGFRWATREGPLIEEPVRNTKFKLVHALVSGNAVERGSGQIIPSARRVVNASILTATPRLMEPWLEVEIMCPMDHTNELLEVLERRRGHVVSNKQNVGTPFFLVRAQVPAIDSFGLETDIRLFTEGQAFVVSCFHHWDNVPGDPLDDSIVLKPLEPSPTLYLAREFLVKTRRRKGLSEDVNLSVYLDEKDREYLQNLSL